MQLVQGMYANARSCVCVGEGYSEEFEVPCMQQASYLEGGPLMWMSPLYINQKSDADDDEKKILHKYH